MTSGVDNGGDAVAEVVRERGGRWRHSSRMRHGARLERWAGYCATEDGWALEMFHETRVSEMLFA